jgi:hypothetical protein
VEAAARLLAQAAQVERAVAVSAQLQTAAIRLAIQTPAAAVAAVETDRVVDRVL